MTLVPSWQFNSDGVMGYIAGGGEHGVQLAMTTEGRPCTRPRSMNLEHYHSRSCKDGIFVPRYKATTHTEKTGEDTVRILIDPYENWRLQATIDFQLLPGPIIAARYEFLFHAPYRGFEALVSNYFHTPSEPFIHVNGKWKQPKLTDNEHRSWARGAAEAENLKAISVKDVKTADDIDVPVDEAYYDYPIIVTPIPDSEQSIVNIVEAKHCSSISANRRWNAHDFSLIARDVAEGEKIVCRAWLCCVKLASFDDALRLAERLERS